MYTNDGLVNKRQELKAFVNSLKDHPHVFAVTEVKPKNMSQQLLVSEFNLQGYNIFCQGLDDPTKRGLLPDSSAENFGL